MTTDEQRGLLHAIRASLSSAPGGLDLYLRRLEGEGAAWDDGQDDDDDEGAGPSDVAGVAAALSEAVRAARALGSPPVLPPFPTSTRELARLLAKYGPDGTARRA